MLSLCFAISLLFCKAQNLVPNPSFEINTAAYDSISGSCILPLGGFGLGMVPPWDSPSNGSPDPFDTCASQFSSAGVPNSMYGYQQPHSGGAFAGATFYESNEFREYIQVQLLSPLVAGRTYCASFFVNLADTVLIACNNLGLYFSNVHLHDSSTQNNLNYIPQINDTNIITDQFNWTEITGQYTALGGESYIIIGNFYPNLQTDTTLVGGWNLVPWAYYFIDDVSVIDCTDQGVDEVGEDGFKLFPNPAKNEINFSTNYKVLSTKIYNVIGEVVNNTINTQTKIDISNIPSGLYFIEIETDGSASSQGKRTARRKFVKE